MPGPVGWPGRNPSKETRGAGSVCEATLSVSGINSTNAGTSKVSNCPGIDERNPETVRSEKTDAGPRDSLLTNSGRGKKILSQSKEASGLIN